MLEKLYEKLLASLGLEFSQSSVVNSSKSVSRKYASKPIQLRSKNVVYPDNRLEKEIQNLYSEIREMQKTQRSKLERFAPCV